ncbi:MAG: 1-acyl-sn-glycerol-3-phosphate acyltransferase, partial [Myxococcota bacterium]
MTPASGTYRSIRDLVQFLLGRWFRRVEVTGQEHLPPDGGGILVSWHPNGLVDPALIVATFPGQVIFGARHGLFRWPGLGKMLKGAGAVPIYRAGDAKDMSPAERREQNAASLDALAGAVAAGGFSCLFPEGDSHDAPH